MANERIQAVMSEAGGFASGTLPAGGSQIVSMAKAPLPSTVTLDSTNGARAIQISTDGGVNFYTPTYDATQTNFINVSIKSSISHVQFTGTSGDAWSIR